MTKSQGVLYQATGKRRYLAVCACSVRSLRWQGYDGAVRVLVDDADIPASLFEGLDVEVVNIEVSSEPRMPSRWVKTQLNRYSPWDETLFLDCDVIVLNDFSSLWNQDNDIELAIAPCFFPIEQSVGVLREEIDYTVGQGVVGVQWNTGVMWWRKSETTDQLFEGWHREWIVFGDNDQLPMMRHLHKNPLNVNVLSKKWNYLDGDAALPLQNRGVVFWHLAGGFDVEKFPYTFGAVFQEQIDALSLMPQDLETEYHSGIQKSLQSLVKKQRRTHRAATVLNTLRSMKHQMRYGRSR